MSFEFDSCMMHCRLRARLQCRSALIQAQINLLDANLNVFNAHHNRRRQRRWWSRSWLSTERRRQFGLYDLLMTELRREDRKEFMNFMRMPPEMFDEILQRVEPRISKQNTFFRDSLDPGLKLAITLRHLASGSKYSNMQYGWRIPHNTISVIVREVKRFEILTFNLK